MSKSHQRSALPPHVNRTKQTSVFITYTHLNRHKPLSPAAIARTKSPTRMPDATPHKVSPSTIPQDNNNFCTYSPPVDAGTDLNVSSAIGCQLSNHYHRHSKQGYHVYSVLLPT